MHLRIFISVMLIALSVGVAIAWRRTLSVRVIASDPSPQQTRIKILVNQIPAERGRIPVEILREKASSTAPNEIEDVSYVIRNNTRKGIMAVTVRQDIAYERGGVRYVETGYAGVEFALHADLSDAQRIKSLSPGSEEVMESAGPTRFDDDAIIKEITLRVDYVRFDDDSTVGKGGEGEQRVILMREGAAKYKEWLVQRYTENGNSMVAILPSLEREDVPEELSFKDISQVQGAKQYRLFLLKKLRMQGAAAVEKDLRR
jgi:hypothetical protein